MKTTKSKKKDTSETKCRSSIQDYFKNASKESNVKSVYVQAVKEKLKSKNFSQFLKKSTDFFLFGNLLNIRPTIFRHHLNS